MTYDRVNIVLYEDTNEKIKAIENKYRLERGRSTVIRMAVDELYKKVIGNGKPKTKTT